MKTRVSDRKRALILNFCQLYMLHTRIGTCREKGSALGPYSFIRKKARLNNKEERR